VWHLHLSRLLSVVAATALLLVPAVGSAAPSSNVPIIGAAGNEWQVVGGNLGNGRYSSLDQVNTSNAQDLKGAWVTHPGSGLGDPKYSLEVSPVIPVGDPFVTMCAPAVPVWASGCVYDAFGKDFPK
jgi:glucose dehydrogenase